MSLRGKKAAILPVDLHESDNGPESYDDWLSLSRNREIPCFGKIHPSEVNNHDYYDYDVVNRECVPVVVVPPESEEYELYCF
jgi:hypothetical protein